VTVAPRSPLELIHPDGVARRACVLAGTLPAPLRPDAGPARPYDLIVAARPSRALTRAWASDALRLAAAELAPDGVAYLAARGIDRAGLRRLATRHGLTVELEIAHLPQLASSTFLAPLEPAPIQFALAELMLMPAWKRRALNLVLRRRRTLPVAFSSVGYVVRRSGSRSCFEWLSALNRTRRTVAVISRTRPGDGPGFFVLHRFSEGDSRPSAIAKVIPTENSKFERETSSLRLIAKTARAAGADVPEALTIATLGTSRVLLLEPVGGRLAATLLARRPDSLETITADVVRWLAAWAHLTAAPIRLTGDLLDRALLQPAQLLVGHISNGPMYAERIERLCAAAEGREIVGTAAHNDLTMWNLLVADGGRIGVVDWETATTESLPLVDFYYAVADAVAATEAYANRARSFSRAFARHHRTARWIAVVEERLMGELRLEHWAAELGFHACWLHHARNELRLAGRARPGPFVQIVEAIADERRGLDRGTRTQASLP